MKKNLLLFATLVCLLLAVPAAAQNGNIYDDANTLWNSLKDPAANKKDVVIAILKDYFKDNTIDATNAAQKVASNPFLSGYAAKIATLMALAGAPADVPTGAGSAFFGSNVTNLAQGAANFLVERGKEEISMAFFQRMKDEFDKYPELKYVLPITSGIVYKIENHNLLTLVQELRDAMRKDLMNAPSNILSMRDLDPQIECSNFSDAAKKTACVKRMKAVKDLLDATKANIPVSIVALVTAQSMIGGDNINVTLNKVATDKDLCSKNGEEVSYLKFVAILLESLRTSKESGALFIETNEISKLINDTDLFKILIGLTYEKYRKLPCYKDISIASQNLESLLGKILKTEIDIRSALNSIDNVNASFKLVRRQILAATTISSTTYTSLLSNSISIVTNTVKAIANDPNIPETKEYQMLLKNVAIASDFSIDIQQQNYSGIFNDLIRVIETNDMIADTNTKDKLIKYLAFASNLASASTSEEVEQAINSVALPPGSFSVKQKSDWNISLNGYIGYCWDMSQGSAPNAQGIYAPIGFAFSKGLGKKNGGALTAFFSVIDLGAMASYQLNTTATDTLKQEVRLESIVSPSAQLIFAVPKLPLSICAGWRKTPKLVYEGQKSFSVFDSREVFSVSILIDIPIFNLWSKPYE
jgi:hypothetical protein